MKAILITCALLLGATPALGQAAEPSDSLVVATAETWLALVDTAEYAASWEEASEFFQRNVTRSQWSQAAAQARAPFGALQARALHGVRYDSALPNAPPGTYAVLEYGSTFTLIPRAVETLMLMEVGPDDWRTAGYFIRPVQ